MSQAWDAVVVGSGPNGLAAAITFARAGLSVLVLEGAPEPGGALRSAALTLPGFRHDTGAAVLPLALGSPFLRGLDLERHGLAWAQPSAPAAHPLDGEPAVLLERGLAATADALGPDGPAYRALVGPLAAGWHELAPDLLGPLPLPPRRPLALARFGLSALQPARLLATSRLGTDRAQALFAGLAAHSVLPLGAPATAAFGVVLGALGHAVGWPFAVGGSGRLADALMRRLRELGGEVRAGEPVRSLAELPPARAVLLDVSPRALVRLAGDRLPPAYRRRLERFRHAPGAFKLDWALDGPVPWSDPSVARAGTVHLGGTLAEIVAAELEVARGGHPERPFVILAQPTLFDPSRAPPGRHTAWAYAHVPNGSTVDLTGRIEAQVERFAPGFRDRILARHVSTPADLERANPNLVGGDVGGGSSDLRQLFHRPAGALRPYATPLPGVYLCSASTPPGGGVHGMCGHRAARLALGEVFGIRAR